MKHLTFLLPCLFSVLYFLFSLQLSIALSHCLHFCLAPFHPHYLCVSWICHPSTISFSISHAPFTICLLLLLSLLSVGFSFFICWTLFLYKRFLKVHYRKGSKQVELFHYIIIIIIHLLFHYNKVRGKIKREEGQGWWENAYLSCSYLLVSYEKTVGMLVFTCNFIVGDQIHQLTDKAHHLLVPGHVGHGKTARRTLSTVGNTLWKQRQFQAYSNVTE